jgi:hypothetical protein
MFFHRPETTRQAYIRILSKHCSGIKPLPQEDQDAALLSELTWSGEYLQGDFVFDEASKTTKAVSVRRVMPQGRLLLEQLKLAESEASLTGKMKRCGLILLGFVLGIIATLIAEYLKKRLGL